jgi:hypothetical protein
VGSTVKYLRRKHTDQGAPPLAIEGLAPRKGFTCKLCDVSDNRVSHNGNFIATDVATLREGHHAKYHKGQPLPKVYPKVTFQSLTLARQPQPTTLR